MICSSKLNIPKIGNQGRFPLFIEQNLSCPTLIFVSGWLSKFEPIWTKLLIISVP